MIKEKVIGAMGAKNSDMPVLRKAIQSFHGEIDSVIISDCSDKPEKIAELKKIEAESQGFVTILYHKDDIGSAAQFTETSRRAVERDATWVITVCDDSVLKPGIVKTMLDAYNSLPPETQKTIGLITPNMRTMRGIIAPEDGEPSINNNGGLTEAQMIKPIVFNTVGYWKEEFHMDQIDIEFMYRIKFSGFKNFFVPRAIVTTRWGHPDMHRIFGKLILIPNYGAYRYYYVSRNLVWMYVRNFRTYILGNDRWYDAIFGILIPRYFIKMLIFERDKWLKTRAIFRGWWDGLTGHLGLVPPRFAQHINDPVMQTAPAPHTPHREYGK